MILQQFYYRCVIILNQQPRKCMLFKTEDYHTQNGNAEQYVTLHQFKGCDISRLLLSQDARIELTDYYVLLAASHTGTYQCVVCSCY